MILLQGPSRVLLHTLMARLRTLDKGVELDYQLVEFDDVRYHIRATAGEPTLVVLSIAVPAPPPETVFSGGLPLGALEAVRATYCSPASGSSAVSIQEPAEPGYQLTLRLDLARLPPSDADRAALCTRLASLRAVVLGAPLRTVLRHLGFGQRDPDADALTALVHRPGESYFVVPQAEKVVVVFPVRFRDPADVVLATAFLQEFVEAARGGGSGGARGGGVACKWTPGPPAELKAAPPGAVDANAGFVTFVVFPRHVEDGEKLDRVVWSLATFWAYVSYHVKCSKAFMHTRMRRRVDGLIVAAGRAKAEGPPGVVKEKKTAQGRSFKRSAAMNPPAVV